MLIFALIACTSGQTSSTASNDTASSPAQPPGIVPFRAATFNIDWLSPRDSDAGDMVPRNDRDREMIRTLITEYDLSLVALQEIEGRAALEALGFDGSWSWEVGRSGRSQNPALLYRADRFEVLDVFELDLPGDGDSARSPLVATIEHVDGLSFVVIVVHFFAYDDDASSSSRQRQARELHDWLGTTMPSQLGEDLSERVVLLGDFNDTVEGINPSYPSLSVFADDDTWRIATLQADGASTVSYNSVIDHVILSAEMVERWTGASSETGVNIIYHDAIEPWASYGGGYSGAQNISSHRPVTLSFNAGALD